MDKAAMLSEMQDALALEDAQRLRERVAQAIPQRLAENGQRLRIHHHLDWDATGIGFATATEMAAELAEGAATLFHARLWYPGAALVRQLIECTYLLTLINDDREEARSWMTSSHDQIVARFLPGQMRKRAGRAFRLGEYEAHCDRGGHPNPAGRHLLRRQAEHADISPHVHWVDLAQHVAEVWEIFTASLSQFDPRMNPADSLYSPHRSPDGETEISALLEEWRRVDPLGRRSAVLEAEHA